MWENACRRGGWGCQLPSTVQLKNSMLSLGLITQPISPLILLRALLSKRDCTQCLSCEPKQQQ